MDLCQDKAMPHTWAELTRVQAAAALAGSLPCSAGTPWFSALHSCTLSNRRQDPPPRGKDDGSLCCGGLEPNPQCRRAACTGSAIYVEPAKPQPPSCKGSGCFPLN